MRQEPRLPMFYYTKHLRWKWLGYIIRMAERLTARQILLNCGKPTLESIFGDLIDPDISAAINLAKDGTEWKKKRPSKRCWSHVGSKCRIYTH